MIDRKAAFSRLNLSRRLDQGDDERKRLQTNRRLESASIGAGGLRVLNGFIVILDEQGNEQMRLSTEGLSMEGLLSVIGAILVTGGGDITIEDSGSFVAQDGSQIRALYDDGSIAVMWGTLIEAFSGDFGGHGLLIQDNEAGNKLDIFRAKRDENGDTFVQVGQSTEGGDPRPIDQFLAWANRIELNAEGTDGVTNGWNLVLNSTENSFLQAVGAVVISSDASQVFVDHATVGSDDNCVISSTGLIRRVTSARRFKQDIRDLSINPRTVLDLKPRTWRDRGEVERDADTDRWHVGFIAEEVEAAGLGMFVNYDEAGEPNSLQYDRITVALLETAKAQQAQLDALTAWATSQGFQPPDVSAETTELPKRRAEAQAKPVKSKAD